MSFRMSEEQLSTLPENCRRPGGQLHLAVNQQVFINRSAYHGLCKVSGDPFGCLIPYCNSAFSI
jgi:hypothetical protein